MKTVCAIRNVLGLLIVSLLVLSPAARATPPTPPVRLEVANGQAKEVILDKDAVPVRIIVRDPEVSDLVVTAVMSRIDAEKPDFEQPPGVQVFNQKLDLARDRALEIPVKADTGVESKLDILLTGKLKRGGGFSNRLVRYLKRDANGRIVMITGQERQSRRDAAKQSLFDEQMRKDPRVHPIATLFGRTAKVPAGAKRAKEPFGVPLSSRIEVRPAELTPFLKKHSADKTATSYSLQDPITVRGRFMFTDIDGLWKPAVNVAIHLWDSDTFFDEHLGMVATDWDGRWSFTVNNDDGWFQDGRDIYYTAKLDTTRLSLGSCNFLAGAYEWKSATHNDLSDGTVVDFGEETGSTDTAALQVYSTLNLAWNHSATAGGFDPGKIDGCFPGSGTFYNGRINIEAGDVNGPDSITHEYGHGVMAHAYSGGDPSPGGDHGFGDCGQDNRLSWSEGWATFFMLTLRQDGEYNWDEGVAGQPIEAFGSSCRAGEGSEGWVAAALLDLFDSNNDNNGGNEDFGRNGASDSNTGNTVALATMLRDTMVGTQHNSVVPFWSDLAGNLTSAQRAPAQTIMNYDWLPVILPSSCVATKVATQALPDPDSVLGGLRKFRDHGLKTWPTGRALANMYYRNSPEIALVLLQNPALIADALTVMRHFASVGETLTNHERYLKVTLADTVLVPPEVAAAAGRVLGGLEAKAGADLKKDIVQVRRELASAQTTKFSQLEVRAAAEKQALIRRGGKLPPLLPQGFTKASKEALQDRRIQQVIERSMGR